MGDGGGGDGDVANGGSDNSDGDSVSSRFESDSGNSETDDDGDDGLLHFVVKHSNALTAVETRRLRFLDITNFIAPGFSYECYLKVYGCELTKDTVPTSGWIHGRS